MRLIRDFPPPRPAPAAIAIGNFDGVHAGHRRLLHLVRQTAAAANLTAAALTFEPHPRAVLHPAAAPPRLGPCADKLRRIAECGITHLYQPRFTPALAAMPAPQFADLLFTRLRARHIIVGENFRFGQNGAGDFALLARTAAAAGARATATPLLHLDGAPVSSARIRRHLQTGDFAAAARLLQRDWILQAKVRRGDGRGRQWGYPTANLALAFSPPLRGIYAARATTHTGATYAAAVSIGTNPTVSDHAALRAEAHLLDFHGDLYGTPLRLHFLQKLRDEKKYATIPDLLAAIARDTRQTRQIAAA